MTPLKSAPADGNRARQALQALPRVPLCHLPTPLERLPGLSGKTGLDLWVKRDDQTGVAFGGNKLRKLEFVVADAIARGCDTLLTWAGVQSNWCRQAAAAARKHGLRPVLLLFRRGELPREVDGNYLIDELLGAKIHLHDLEPGRDMMSIGGVEDLLAPIIAREEADGHKVYVAPIGASRTEGSMTAPLGGLAFVLALQELLDQARQNAVPLGHVVMASSSGSMHAGLAAGIALEDADVQLTGISVAKDEHHLAPAVAEMAREILAFLETPGPADRAICLRTEFGGAGYGLLNSSTVRAIRMAAELDGLLLDPVYTGKAMTGLIKLAEQGYFRPGERVVFLHTGGLPALFPYREQLLQTEGLDS